MTTALAPPLRPGRPIVGAAAVLLPFTDASEPDWASFEVLLGRVVEAGLTPAVNMDTGYAHLLDQVTKSRVLETTSKLADRFIAGAAVLDREGDSLDLDGYLRACEAILASGGAPIVVPSFGLTSLGDDELVAAYSAIAGRVDQAYFFELSQRFHPAGRIFSLEVYAALMAIPQYVGAKHSSLERGPEWQRLVLRDAIRPDFRVMTGNDLAIDMVMWGSDYLLGLATFDPGAFGTRDRLWASGDPDFYELNDVLQYLGQFAFRDPTPAYRHQAAQYLSLTGVIAGDATPHSAPRRPDSDRLVLKEIADRLARWRS